MNNNVVIKICGMQVIEETGDSVEMTIAGKYYFKNNKHYLLYDEVDEENGIKIKNTIKFNDQVAEVTRKGSVNGKMLFEKGENNQSLYSTPFGDLLIEIFTKNIEIAEKNSEINLKIDYELYANNDKVSDSQIAIDVNETLS